ncbi:TIGR03862 family flavoprotein [Lichenihabitans sp. Uapishka_5]|uniref:TIGR03862 family flavoprotein n=1 Tax=Lichenihabitans sp. Uapishka_5 TaxID=3037302 RepID=UPI0029E7EE64|nr:TIGR03862 family flavoprotein [Lichenihabitans sp. Uapishka_5]MDX7952055.1 TIGR03862 family flavoprotein [Lichenihabitans sp. Uapishka_5]
MNGSAPRTAAVVGAGPAGLMAAEVLAEAGARVTVFDQMPSIGRKLLMAGLSGLNLTHTEPLPALLARYGDAGPLQNIVSAWPAEQLRAWCHGLGQDTFVGSSGRVFPTAMKASPLLRAWQARLVSLGVMFRMRHRWIGWTEGGALRFETPDGSAAIEPDTTLLALGGASWPRLGSDGRWADTFAAAGVPPRPFAPANCGFAVAWSETFLARHEGMPLKGVVLRFAGREVRGDLVVTRLGLEGGPLYALAAPLRDALAAGAPVDLTVGLHPDLDEAAIADRLSRRRSKDSLATALRKTLALAPVAIGLLQEAAHGITHEDLSRLDATTLARRIAAVPVRLSGPAPLARAISTAGGTAFADCNDDLMLRARPGTFLAGEMLDWEAPTGGYLLQACFATGRAAGLAAKAWLDEGVNRR